MKKLDGWGAWAAGSILEFSLILSLFTGIIGLILFLINLYFKKKSSNLFIYFLIAISPLILFFILKILH